MEVKETRIKTFQGSIFIGLEKGYTEEKINQELVIATLAELQKKISFQKKIFVSASVSKTNIILNNQNECHLKIDFVNYPLFPLNEQILKEEVIFIAKNLMNQYEQNRILIIFTDETIMLEQSEKIDPRIMK